jgi:hypothetical protein
MTVLSKECGGLSVEKRRITAQTLETQHSYLGTQSYGGEKR